MEAITQPQDSALDRRRQAALCDARSSPFSAGAITNVPMPNAYTAKNDPRHNPPLHRECGTMDLDDIPIGKLVSRREALAFLGASGALLFFGCSSSANATAPEGSASSCLVRPELTEGRTLGMGSTIKGGRNWS